MDTPIAMDDLYHHAAALADRRSWLRMARHAPVPPSRIPYIPLDLAAHDAAIAAALERGHTTLDDWRNAPMPRSIVPSAPASVQVTCLVCETERPRALAGHAICARCANAPTTAHTALDTREAQILAGLVPVQSAYDAAHDALTDDERSRWQAIVQARLAATRAGRWLEQADGAARQRLAAMRAAMDRNDARIPVGLRRMWDADEALFWANELAADAGRRVAIAREQYAACLVALGQRQMFDDAA